MLPEPNAEVSKEVAFVLIAATASPYSTGIIREVTAVPQIVQTRSPTPAESSVGGVTI